jgi:uncharacterized heparinase superfamily protein
MNMARALLYARTLRHLRPVQVVGRAAHLLRRTRLDRSPAPGRRAARPLPAPATRAAVLLAPTRVRMLGVEGDLATATDWDDPSRPALWRYHAHYFDDLRAEGALDRADWNRALITRWLTEVRPGEGVGWDPYPTSLRIVNWVRRGLSEQGLGDEAVQSLAVQARHLERNLEHHLLGNHLLANAKALVFAGGFFGGSEGDRWAARGAAILARELAEQVLEDGGHFERSPMYHALVLEDVLDLIALAESTNVLGSELARWRAVAQAMRRYLRAVSHPDGEIALFNDSAIGQAPTPTALDDYARRLGLADVAAPRDGLTHLAPSGIVRIERDGLLVLCDVGEIGPSYLPGHAHADTLTFEASLAGARWIVDSGISHYEPGAERLRQRSTAAHNTVEVDGESSSEVWGSFRVARRAHPRDLCLEEQADSITVSCSHDGYRRLSGAVRHRRTWRVGRRSLAVEDELHGRFSRAIGRFFLHPEAAITDDMGAMMIGGRNVHASFEGGVVRREASTWHPSFGASLPTEVVTVSWDAPRARAQFTW